MLFFVHCSVSLMACISSLTNIARQRPSNMSTVVQTFELLHGNAVSHFTTICPFFFTLIIQIPPLLMYMLRTVLELPARFEAVRMDSKPSEPENGFNTVGLASFEPVPSQPGTSITLWLCSCVMIKIYAELYTHTPVICTRTKIRSLAPYCIVGAVLLQQFEYILYA